MFNYLNKVITEQINETHTLSANLFVINSFLEDYKKVLINRFPVPKYLLMATSPAFRDMSDVQEWMNLLPSGFYYELNTSNLELEIKRLKSYTSCLVVSQAYELFESFLKDVVALLMINNQVLFDKYKHKLELEEYSYESIRKDLKKLQGTNNAGFIKILKAHSPFLKKHMTYNIYRKNMGIWFKLLSELRHITVHNRQLLTRKFSNLILNKNHRQMFDEYFSILSVDKQEILFLENNNASEIINHLCDFSFLIYKSLSIDFELPLLIGK